MENPATTNQPREPLATLPIPGISTRTSMTTADREPGERQAAHQLHRHPQRDVEREQADDRPQHLLAEDAHGEPSSS